MARVDWPEATRQAFIAQQFQAQYRHYRSHYPNALFLMVCHADQAIGRLYLSPGSSEMRLMDLIILPAWRQRGLARALLSAVLDWVLGEHLELTLHVEADNPARAWYQRLGFEDVALRGVYWFMRLPAESARAAQLKLIS
jgi:GNAT superfamily N-acetyltransferase